MKRWSTSSPAAGRQPIRRCVRFPRETARRIFWQATSFRTTASPRPTGQASSSCQANERASSFPRSVCERDAVLTLINTRHLDAGTEVPAIFFETCTPVSVLVLLEGERIMRFLRTAAVLFVLAPTTAFTNDSAKGQTFDSNGVRIYYIVE